MWQISFCDWLVTPQKNLFTQAGLLKIFPLKFILLFRFNFHYFCFLCFFLLCHRRVFGALLYTDKVISPLITGEFFGVLLYTDRVTSPLIIGEFLVPYNIQTELSRR